MKVKYEAADPESSEIELTPRFQAALIELMGAEVEMLAAQDKYPDSWHWGRCFIEELCSTSSLKFTFGGEEDIPGDGLGRFAVVIGKVQW